MSKLKDLIDVARHEVGACETPMGSNDVKYNREYWGERSSYADLPWCVVFCWWCCKHAPEQIPFPTTAHCNGVEAYAKSNNAWVTGSYQPGDFVIFDYDGDGSRDHIGLVTEANGYNLTTVEGNYGDKVSFVKRTAGEIVGAYRPDYGNQPTPAPEPEPDPVEPCELPRLSTGDIGPAVAFLQGGLRAIGYPCGDSYYPDGRADGEYGVGTEKAVMQLLGVPYVDEDGWKKLIGGVG